MAEVSLHPPAPAASWSAVSGKPSRGLKHIKGSCCIIVLRYTNAFKAAVFEVTQLSFLSLTFCTNTADPHTFHRLKRFKTYMNIDTN